jgi:hypothetical protein
VSATEGAQPPYLVWQLVVPHETEHTFTQKVSDNDEYQFYAWAEDTDTAEGVATARAIIDRLEAVLFDAALDVSPLTLLYCRKQRNLPDLKDPLSGGAIQRYGKGQQWRIEVS